MLDLERFILVPVFFLLIILLIIDKWKPSLLFGGASVILLSFNIITPSEFLEGYANESIVTIFLLIFTTSLINENFDLIGYFGYYLDGVNTIRGFLIKMGIGVSVMSSFINNTPIVALMLPVVYDWGKKRNIAPSLLLIPLSYMTILGGMITLIGTSTNLVLNGFILSNGLEPLSARDYLIPGILVTSFGIIFISLIGYKLLPKNKDVITDAKLNLKEYIAEIEINPNSNLINKSVMEAGLRNLDGIFLFEIIRGEKVISPVEPNEILLGKDRLFFAGETDKIINLMNHDNGLFFPKHVINDVQYGLEIIEVVIPANSEIVGKSLKDIQFREKYNAAVIAIHRNGERVGGKIGEVLIDKGDLLMLSIGKDFLQKQKFDKNFYLISKFKKDLKLNNHKRLVVKISIGLLLILYLAGAVSFFTFLALVICSFILVGSINIEQLKKLINIDLLVILGSSLSLSSALLNSNITKDFSQLLSQFTKLNSPSTAVIFIYFSTVLLTTFITNAAAVAIIFPIGYSFINSTGINPQAIFLTIAFGASCCFLTPIGYQTNLMVQAPGNYKFIDYFKLGIPLTVIYSTIALTWIIYNYL